MKILMKIMTVMKICNYDESSLYWVKVFIDMRRYKSDGNTYSWWKSIIATKLISLMKIHHRYAQEEFALLVIINQHTRMKTHRINENSSFWSKFIIVIQIHHTEISALMIWCLFIKLFNFALLSLTILDQYDTFAGGANQD